MTWQDHVQEARNHTAAAKLFNELIEKISAANVRKPSQVDHAKRSIRWERPHMLAVVGVDFGKAWIDLEYLGFGYRFYEAEMAMNSIRYMPIPAVGGQ